MCAGIHRMINTWHKPHSIICLCHMRQHGAQHRGVAGGGKGSIDREEGSTEADPVPTLVSTQWLADRVPIGRPSSEPKQLRVVPLQLLDGSWHKPITKRNARLEFLEKHIPSAQFFDIDGCRDKTSLYELMLPPVSQFEDYVGNLGIDKDTHVVVYDNNETIGMFTAQRVWWTFRVFGHQKVSILDGGLPQWIREDRLTTAEVDTVKGRVFHGKYNPHLLRRFEDVKKNLLDKKYLVVDTRTQASFDGTKNDPTSKIKSGHILGAVNISYTLFIDPNTKLVKSPEDLRKVFDGAGVDLNKPVISSCGSGVSACSLVLAAHLLGHKDIPVYDGSWSEWFRRAEPEEKVVPST